MRDRLDTNLQLYQSQGKRKEYLLAEGLPLAEGETLLKKSESSLGASELAYIRASIAERRRQQNRRTLIAISTLVLLGAMILFGALALVAVNLWHNVDTAWKLADTARKFAEQNNELQRNIDRRITYAD
jgi:hypothetical protein